MKRKNKIISIFSKKGGVTKTTLAGILQNGLSTDKWYQLTNDSSTAEDIYEKAEFIEELELFEESNVIYDLGGFVAENLGDLLIESDLVIIPTLLDKNSIDRAYSTIKEIQELGQTNILLVINRFKMRDTLKFKKEIDFLTAIGGIDILYMNESTLYLNALRENLNIYDYMATNSFNFKQARRDINGLLNFVSKNLNIDIEKTTDEQMQKKITKKLKMTGFGEKKDKISVLSKDKKKIKTGRKPIDTEEKKTERKTFYFSKKEMELITKYEEETFCNLTAKYKKMLLDEVNGYFKI